MATAYVSLVVDGSRLGKGAREAGQEAGREYGRGFDDEVKKRPAPDPGKGADRKSRESGRKSGDAYAGEFNRQVQGKVGAAMKALPKVNVDADTSPAQKQIQQVRASLEKISKQRIGIDIDNVAALSQIEGMQKRLAKLSSTKDIGIRVDAGAAQVALAAVQRQVTALDGKTVNIDVDANTGGFLAKMALVNAASRSAGGGMGFATTAALLLSPALIGVAAAAGAVAIAMSGALMGAAALGGALAAGVGVAVVAGKPVKEAVGLYDSLQEAIGTYGAKSKQAVTAQKKLNYALGEMTPAGRDAYKTVLTGLRPALSGLAKDAQNAALPGISKGLASLVPFIKRFSPLITDLGGRFGTMAEAAGKSLNGPFWKSFQSFLTGSLPGWFTTASHVVGNFARGFASLFMGLAPTADDFAGSIERFSQKFRAWAGSGTPAAGFERFMNSAREILPKVILFVSTLWGAFSNVTIALAPLAPLMLGIIQSVASFIEGMDPAHIRGFAIAIGVWLGVMKLARITVIAITIATKAWMVAQWLMNAAMSANPIGLIIVGLVALGAGLVLLWKKSSTFRDIVTGAWTKIKGAFVAVWDWVKKNWPLLLAILTGPFAPAVIAITKNWDKIKGAATAVKDWFVGAFKATWDKIKGVLTAPVKAAKSAISALLDNKSGIRKVFANIWSWIKTGFGLWWKGVTAYFTAPIRLAKAAISVLFDSKSGVRKVFSNLWGWAKGKFKAAWDGLKKIITAPVSLAKAVIAGILGKKGLQDVFTKARDRLGDIWDGLKKIFKEPINIVIGFTNKLIDGVNRILPGGNAQGVKGRNIGRLPKLRDGGMVPASWRVPGQVDNVLGVSSAGVPTVRVDPGERILSARSTRSLDRRYPGVMDYANKHGRLPGYQTGGVVGRYYGGLPGYANGTPKGGSGGGFTWPLIWNYVRKHFSGISKSSDYRRGAMSNRRSSHALGTAIDITGSQKAVSKVMTHMAKNYGRNMRDLIYSPLWGKRMISDGRWIPAPNNLYRQHFNHGHIGLLPGRTLTGGKASGADFSNLTGEGTATSLWDKFKAKITGLASSGLGVIGKLGGIGGTLAKGVGKVAINGVTDWAKDKMSGIFDGDGDAPIGKMASGAGVKALQGMLQGVVQPRGWDKGKQWSALNWLVNKESSWRPTIKNPGSSAYGLFQFLDSTWKTVGGKKTSDPLKQMIYGAKYIAQKYGNPVAAKAFHRGHNWYADGTKSASRGLAVVGERGPELVDFRGGERVYTNTETKQILGGGGLTPDDVQRFADAVDRMEAATYAGVATGFERAAQQARIGSRQVARSGSVSG